MEMATPRVLIFIYVCTSDSFCPSFFTAMKKISVVFVLVAISFVTGRTTSKLEDDDPLKLVKETINYANKVIAEDNHSTFQVPGISYEISVIQASIRNIIVGNFSTLNLKGDDQTFTISPQSDSIIFKFDLKIGLDEFKTAFQLSGSIFYLLQAYRDVEIYTTTNSIRIQGHIKATNTSCSAQLENVQISSLDDFHVNITPSGSISSYISSFIQQSINYGLYFGQYYINNFLEYQVASVQKQFSDIACMAFPHQAVIQKFLLIQNSITS